MTSQDISVCKWWHSIRLPDGRVTPGAKSLNAMDREAEAIFKPLDLSGKSVLDVGAWNGGFSIEAHRRGAGRIVALDYYSLTESAYSGLTSIKLSTSICNVPIEIVDYNLDSARINLDFLGKFDVVLFLGVFYHLADPIAALREVASLAKDVLVIETRAEKYADNAIGMRLFKKEDTPEDWSNYWIPCEECVKELLLMMGFSTITVQYPMEKNRPVFHAFRNNELGLGSRLQKATLSGWQNP